MHIVRVHTFSSPVMAGVGNSPATRSLVSTPLHTACKFHSERFNLTWCPLGPPPYSDWLKKKKKNQNEWRHPRQPDYSCCWGKWEGCYWPTDVVTGPQRWADKFNSGGVQVLPAPCKNTLNMVNQGYLCEMCKYNQESILMHKNCTVAVFYFSWQLQ